MNNILKTVLQLSISGSIFFIIFYLISFFTKRIFSAKWHFLILKLNMIFYIFPIVLIHDFFSRSSRKIYLNSFNIAFNEIANRNNSLKFFNCLFIIWILGVSVFIIWNIYCYHKFIKEIIDGYSDSIFIITNNCGQYMKNILNVNIIILFADDIYYSYKKIVYMCASLDNSREIQSELIMVSREISQDMDCARSITREFNKRLWEKQYLKL